jgi:DNA (cytosine-5)-methyltransferase 1
MTSTDAPRTSKYGVKLVRGPFVRLAPHPLAVNSQQELRTLAPRLRRPFAADLFCGAGGLSLGLARAGYTIVLGVDNDPAALETHRSIHAGLSVNWDMADLEVVERVGDLLLDLDIDLVAGGPPCQPFSRAGRSGMRDLVRRGVRRGHDMRRDLWQSFLRIVSIARPRAVLMENVPDMALDRDMWILRTMVDELENMGYAVEERLLATGDYGVPQFRQRLFLVALADRRVFSWPERDPNLITVRNAIGDLPPVEGGWRPDNGDDPSDPVASGWSDYAGPQTEFQRAMRSLVPPDQLGRVYDHITRPVRLDDAETFNRMDPATKYSDLDPELRRYRADIFDDKYKRLDWNTLSRTIVAHIAKDGYWYIHPEQPRTLTVREAARLQTFPDHIRFAGPPSSAFRQIGNAVPPQIGYVLGRAVRQAVDRAAGEPLSTSEVSKLLAGWFDGRVSLAVPWLRAVTRWQVISAEILWGRLAREHVRHAWALIEPLADPGATLRHQKLLAIATRRLARVDRLHALEKTAAWFIENSDALGPDAGVEWLLRAPGVTPAMADLAIRICPSGSEDRDEPVLVTNGVLRVASRFLGADVEENQNRLSDGRLAIARLIGGDDSSHAAHLALIELAASCCSPTAPECSVCPLVAHCDHARRTGHQLALGLTTPALGPHLGRARTGAQ